MRLIVAICIGLTLSACHHKSYSPPANNPALDKMLTEIGTQPAPAVSTVTVTPTCYSKQQCDAMWSEAAVEIQNVSRMRLQIANDTYMQTFNPVSFGGLAGEARKIPQPDGSTIIQASFACRYCGDLPDSALKLFNLSVQNSGRGFPEPYKAPSWSDEIKKTPSAEPASEPSFSPALIRYN